MNNPLNALRKPAFVKPLDVTKFEPTLEDGLADIVKTVVPDEPVYSQPPLPDYIQHLPGVDEIGKLSAAAIAGQYETAAKTIEAMGVDLVQCVKNAERLAAEAKEAIEHVEDLAKRYRDQAKSMLEQIERASLLTKDVRAACDEMRRKLQTEIDS